MLSTQEALENARDWYFKRRPDFHAGDKRRVKDLIYKNLEDPQNSGELDCLRDAMEIETDYHYNIGIEDVHIQFAIRIRVVVEG